MGRNKKKRRLPESDHVVISPKTQKQEDLINAIEEKEVVIATGSSGVGKTYVALGTALSLLDRGYKTITLIKSVTSIPGEEIGYLKGSMEDKMEPFLMSYTWTIDKIVGMKNQANELIRKGLIQILPIAYARGLSIDDSIVIIDEAQNINNHTFKTLMSRIGENSKYIFLGDVEQVDRKRKNDSCLQTVVDIFRDSDHIGIIEFEDSDCVRNPIIPEILEKLREHNI